jgi:hypothetical protein
MEDVIVGVKQSIVELVLDKVVKEIVLEIVNIVEFAWDRNMQTYSHSWVLAIPVAKDSFVVRAIIVMALWDSKVNIVVQRNMKKLKM